MQTIDYSAFEQILYRYAKDLYYGDQAAFTTDLLSCNMTKDGFVISTSLASKYRNGKEDIASEIIKTFATKLARTNTIQKMKDVFVDCVPRGRKQALIYDFEVLISKDAKMDDELRKQIMDEAKPDCLAEFLADILIYAVAADCSKTDKSLRKLGAPALTVLINEAVPEVVKRVLALQYMQYNDDPEVTQLLTDGHTKEFIDSLVKKRRMSGKEYYQWHNILNITGMAQDELEKDTEKADEYVAAEFDVDWYMQFFEKIANISRDDLQKLCAKILSQKIKDNNSFRIDTVNTLVCLSRTDIKRLEIAARVVIENLNVGFRVGHKGILFFPKYEEVSEVNWAFQIEDELMYFLQNYGIVLPERNGSFVFAGLAQNLEYPTVRRDMLLSNSNENMAIRIADKQGATSFCRIPYTCYLLTSKGEELLSLIGEPDDEYLKMTGAALSAAIGESYSIGVYKVNKCYSDRRCIFNIPEDDLYITLDYDNDLIKDYPLEDKIREKLRVSRKERIPKK